MAFVDLPVFVARQILTAALLNQIVTALQGFSAQTSDIAWPLQAGGDIDFGGLYGIQGLRTFWNIVNASEYATLDAALSAVEDAGASGGCLFIPPNTTVKGSTGVSIDTSNVWVVGCGTTSIVELESGVGPLFDTTANLSNIGFMNVQLLESSSSAGAGIVFRRTTNPRLINVLFTNFDSDSVYYTNDGTPGNSCADAFILGAQFAGGGASGDHLKADDLDGLFADQILSTSAGGDAIAFEATGNAIMRDIQFGSNVRIEAPGNKGISILGGGAADDKWSRISLTGLTVVDPTDDGIELGEASKLLRDVTAIGCNVLGTITADGMVVNAQGGLVSGCKARNAGDDGLDLVASEDVTVTGCYFQDAGGYGIDAEGTTDCTVIGNNVRDWTTEGVRKDTTTGLEASGNIGDIDKTPDTVHCESPSTDQVGAGTTTTVTYTIPANTLSKSGDGVRVTVAGTASGLAVTTLTTKLAGATLSAVVGSGGVEFMGTTTLYVNSVGPNGAGSNVDSIYIGASNGGANQQAGLATVSADLTGDVNLTVDLTVAAGGGTGTHNFFILEYLGGDFA